MLLVEKCTFFINSFLFEIRLGIMFNNILDRKETFFDDKKIQSLKVPKLAFLKGPMLLVKKMLFLY